MPLGTNVGVGPGDVVLDWGPSSPAEKRTQPPQFSALIYCGEMPGLIDMSLGAEVGLGPGDIVLDGNTAPPKKGHSPHFSAHIYCSQMAE